MQPRPCGQDRADGYEGKSVWYVRQRAKNHEADTCRSEASAGLFTERLRKQRKLTWRACQHSGPDFQGRVCILSRGGVLGGRERKSLWGGCGVLVWL